MIKKIFFLSFILMFCAFLTGCTKYQANIEINDNLEVSTSLFYGSVNSVVVKQIAPVEIRDKIDDAILETLKKQIRQDEHSSIEIKRDGDYIGLLMKRTNPNSSKVFLPPGINTNNKAIAMVKHTGFKKVYTVSLNAETGTLKKFANEFGDELKNNPFYYAYLKKAGQPIYQVTIKIPHKATSTNATTRDDINYIYTWVLDIESKTPIEINLQYEKFSFHPKMIFYILFGFIAIFLAFNSIRNQKES